MSHPMVDVGIRFPIGLLLSVLALGCSGGGEGKALEVVDPWVRPMSLPQAGTTPSAPFNTAAYMIIRNPGATPDKLLSASTPVASKTELHESVMEGDVMRMVPVESLDLPGRGMVRLEPGGLHLMLLGLTRSLVSGDTVSLTLSFQVAGSVEVRVPVMSGGGI